MFKVTKKVTLVDNAVITLDPDGAETARQEFDTPEEARTEFHSIFTEVNEDPEKRVENAADGMEIFEFVND